MNNLLGLLLRWREEKVAIVGDIKKMYNSVHLEMTEQHCHRFLWRDLNTDRTPDIYVMTRVNIGDRPAGQIATEALYKTADLFHSDSPSAAKLLKDSTYVDDILDSIPNRNTAEVLSKEAEEMLLKGGFHIKFWQFSGEKLISKQVKDTTAVLGVSWKPMEDTITFKASLNFSRKKQGAHTGPDLKYSDIPHSIPLPLTKRMVLSQVMKIYDPLGLLCPFTLYGKIYLRETWALKLGWDVALPDNLREKMDRLL